MHHVTKLFFFRNRKTRTTILQLAYMVLVSTSLHAMEKTSEEDQSQNSVSLLPSASGEIAQNELQRDLSHSSPLKKKTKPRRNVRFSDLDPEEGRAGHYAKKTSSQSPWCSWYQKILIIGIIILSLGLCGMGAAWLAQKSQHTEHQTFNTSSARFMGQEIPEVCLQDRIFWTHHTLSPNLLDSGTQAVCVIDRTAPESHIIMERCVCTEAEGRMSSSISIGQKEYEDFHEDCVKTDIVCPRSLSRTLFLKGFPHFCVRHACQKATFVEAYTSEEEAQKQTPIGIEKKIYCQFPKHTDSVYECFEVTHFQSSDEVKVTQERLLISRSRTYDHVIARIRNQNIPAQPCMDFFQLTAENVCYEDDISTRRPPIIFYKNVKAFSSSFSPFPQGIRLKEKTHLPLSSRDCVLDSVSFHCKGGRGKCHMMFCPEKHFPHQQFEGVIYFEEISLPEFESWPFVQKTRWDSIACRPWVGKLRDEKIICKELWLQEDETFSFQWIEAFISDEDFQQRESFFQELLRQKKEEEEWEKIDTEIAARQHLLEIRPTFQKWFPQTFKDAFAQQMRSYVEPCFLGIKGIRIPHELEVTLNSEEMKSDSEVANARATTTFEGRPWIAQKGVITLNEEKINSVTYDGVTLIHEIFHLLGVNNNISSLFFQEKDEKLYFLGPSAVKAFGAPIRFIREAGGHLFPATGWPINLKATDGPHIIEPYVYAVFEDLGHAIALECINPNIWKERIEKARKSI